MARNGRGRLRYVPDDPLLNSTEAAAERGTARSTFWNHVKAGLAPAPIYVSPRCPRWRRSWLRPDVEAERVSPKEVADPKAA
jgi:predicted DNA-binding transcriptional regulator AlpA